MKERTFTRGTRGNMSVQMILEIQDELVTDDNIGKYLGITRQAVYCFRKRHGIPPVKDKSVSRDTLIRNLRKDGRTLRYIADAVEMSLSQVARIVKGLPQPRPSKVPEPQRQPVPQEMHPTQVAP